MSALASRLVKLEQQSNGVFGRFILLGGDPHPSDFAVTDFLHAQSIVRAANDMVMAGMDEPSARPGAALTVLHIVPCDRPHELALADL